MPFFKYTALDNSNKKTKGVIEALHRKQAILKLRIELKVEPISVELDDSKPSSGRNSDFTVEDAPKLSLNSTKQNAKIHGEKVALDFFKKLLQLNSSGLPVGDAIRTLGRRVADPSLRLLSSLLWKDLSEGLSLATALSRYPKTFDITILHLIEAGEATGNLGPILSNVIDLLETRAALRKKIASSLVYPIFISLMALGVVALFLFFLLPRIKGMLASLGGELSFSAKVLIGFADVLVKQGPFILLFLVLSFIFLNQWRRTKRGLKATDRFYLKIPLLGPIFKNADLCRISNLMATLLESGVTMNEALLLVEKAIKNTHLQARFAASRASINDGASFSSATAHYRLFPDMDIDIITVGENTGNLVKSFKEIYKTHTEELANELKIITTTISSAAMLFAFSLVAILTFGIVTSIMQLSQSLLQ